MFKKKRTALALVGALSLVLVLLLVACAAAPAITVTPASVVPGGKVTVAGTGFQNGEKVTLTIGTVALGTATAGTDGTFSAKDLVVSTDIKAGAATVTAKGDKGAAPPAIPLTVTSAKP